MEKVTETVYLGQTIALTDRTDKEIDRRIKISWKIFWSLKNIFNNNFKPTQKAEVFNMCVTACNPTLTYGLPNWNLTVVKISKYPEVPFFPM